LLYDIIDMTSHMRSDHTVLLLPEPDTSEHTPPARQAGNRFTYPVGMEG